MDVLVRQKVRLADGTSEFYETELAVAEITLGTDATNAIPLGGRGIEPFHATLRLRGASVEVVSRVPFQHRGRRVRKITLSPGQAFRMGDTQIELIPAPAGFDVALEISKLEGADADVQPVELAIDIEPVFFSRRSLAWLAVVAIFGLALLVPLGTSVLIGERELPAVFTDQIWSSGALHPGHDHAAQGDCSICHAEPFRRVRDTACLECHQGTGSHIREGVATFDAGNGDRCGACHREHNGTALLVDAAAGLCIDCHRSDILSEDAHKIESVRGFAEALHPPFGVTLPVASVAGAVAGQWDFVRTALDVVREDSRLSFDHAFHLDPQKVQLDAEGRGMACADCHVASRDREHFVPITMEQSCAGCHRLTFDQADSNRLLPHTTAREVIRVMQGHFIRDALEPVDDGFGGYRWRRIPDRPDREYGCKKSPLECAQDTVLAEVRLRFDQPASDCAANDPDCVARKPAGCLECHQVLTYPDKALEDRYVVVPVRLPQDFYPAQRFDHSSHSVMQDKTGDAACGVCHSADSSESSADVLLPDIDTCLDCHGDVGTRVPVQTTCIACHGFHPPRRTFATGARP